MAQLSDINKAVLTMVVAATIGFSIVVIVKNTMRKQPPVATKTITVRIANPWAINMAGNGRPTEVFMD